MHPEPPHDVTRDPILDGRDSLRLVKLRLALTLITVAILPVAAVAPLVRAVAEEARVAHHLRLEAQAGQASTTIGRELDAISTATDQLASDPAILAVVTGGATAAERSAAGSRLGNLLGRRSGSVVGADVVVDAAVVASWGSVLALPDKPADGISLAPKTDDGSPLLVSVAGVSGRGHAQVVATVSLPVLLSWAMPDPPIPGESLYLADANGDPVALQHSSFDAAAIPGQVLDLATEAAHESDGQHALAVPGLDGWTIAVNAPIPLAALPLPAIAALATLIVLLIGFTLWMARQILRPAAQLEASRSRMRELYESAREAALRDSLTGLGNHRAFQEAVARMVEGSRRYGTAFSLILLDIDEFKRINDTRGHAVGDQLLTQLGDLIRVTIRITDAGFRVGGDEFAILLPHTDANGAIGLCRRLLARSLEDRGAGAYRGPISFSAGVTACPTFGATRLELTAQADAALYRGKRTGRTVVTIFDPEIDRGHVDEGMRAELSSAITAVVESGSLTPVYQPIVELSSGRILGYEGLVRVPRESTFAHAGALFDAAEAAGRVADLDRAALDVVLAGTKGIPTDVLVSLNVSPRTLETGDLNATSFLAILRRHGVSPTRVILELTEREAVREPERLRETLRGVQLAGVRIAADDVGAGNAGLRLLSQFQFDVVKIDLSLVQGGSRGGGGTDQTLSVLGSLVQMADRLGALTIAEGVETPEQLRTIRDLGIAAGQGYLLGRPGPQHELGWVDLDELANREEVPDPQSPFRPRSDPLRVPTGGRPAQVTDATPQRRGGDAAESPGDEPWPGVLAPGPEPTSATGTRVQAVRRSLPFVGRTRDQAD
ncbi:MAG TPA: bifunctional diguanylate cyclase/phosphodiesterase [Candidatus Limnocylindrales bacterium]|nr:bifunctional diguanylate cyclase/phosphodiesterase [Candidatus Limnocylindrales bacterium]